MINITQHLITNNLLHIFSNKFAFIHSNSSYYSLFERAELIAYAYKIFIYQSKISIPRYLHLKIIMNFYAS